MAQLAIARLYDRTRDTVTIRRMLHQAANQLPAFQRATPSEASDAIMKSAKRVIALQPVLDSIRLRRNEWLAHLDPRSVIDPTALSEEAKLTVPDLERAFKETEGILVELSNLYEGVFGELRFVGGHDYEAVLDNIRRYKCAFIREYEKQFGAYTGPRPKDCSQAPYDLI